MDFHRFFSIPKFLLFLVRKKPSRCVRISSFYQQYIEKGKKGATATHNSSVTKITDEHEHYSTPNCHQWNSHIHRVAKWGSRKKSSRTWWTAVEKRCDANCNWEKLKGKEANWEGKFLIACKKNVEIGTGNNKIKNN